MDRPLLNTVHNAGRVLDLFSAERPDWGVTELADALAMPKSNVHALVTSLAGIGMLTRTGHGRYRLGWHLVTLSERLRSGLSLREVSAPHMRGLVRDHGEAVLLGVLDRGDVLYLDRAEGTHPTVRIVGVRPGGRRPAYCTAIGKILLADLDAAAVRETVGPAPFRVRSPQTVADHAALGAVLDEVRMTDVAYDLGEIVQDACGVAAPIRDGGARVVAGLCVSVPAYRFAACRDRLTAGLLAATRAISAELAGGAPAAPARPEPGVAAPGRSRA
jgi:DNA-binding IclR family transcriptional regulator